MKVISLFDGISIIETNKYLRYLPIYNNRW